MISAAEPRPGAVASRMRRLNTLVERYLPSALVFAATLLIVGAR